MKLRKFVTRVLTSTQRSKQKKQILNRILDTPQSNKGVVNLHRIDTNNAGDYYCAPHHYFEELRNTSLDIFDYKDPDKHVTENWVKKISDNQLIIGGGGLLNRGSFEKQMKLYASLAGEKNKKTVLWGVGHNSKNPGDFGRISSYNIDASRFGLVGTRDYNVSGEWVPCVSCLHPVFDKSFTPTQETGVIFHKKTLKRKSITSKFHHLPSTSNTTDLEALIQFIGNSETIITDSYHAMYWSILLDKKVVVVPNSSKFFDFKYEPVISTFDDCLKDINKAQSYSGVLEECREINHKFAKKVFNYLEL